MMTEGLYKLLLFKTSSAKANTPRQLSHFSCRWAILMQLLCTFSTTKLSVPFLWKTSELNRMTKLTNYCIFFLSAAQHLIGAISGGAAWSRLPAPRHANAKRPLMANPPAAFGS